MRILCALAIFLVAATASATKPVLEKPESTQVEQQQSQTQGQQQTQSAQGGAASNEGVTAVNAVSSRSLSLFNASAIPSACPPGWVNGRKFKRAWQTPIVGVSAICVRDEQAVKDIEAARAHELEVLRLQIELAREAQRRIAADSSRVEAVSK